MQPEAGQEPKERSPRPRRRHREEEPGAEARSGGPKSPRGDPA